VGAGTEDEAIPAAPGGITATASSASPDAAPSTPSPWRAWLRLEALIPLVIAVVSLIGAAVTWRAADTAARAGGMDTQALRESVEVQQIDSQIDAVLAHDQRIFAEYQEHIVAWRALLQRATDATATDLTRDLRFEAHAELVLARTLRSLFRAHVPDFGDKDGLVEYDADTALEFLRSQNARLTELDPEATLDDARRLHEHAVGLVAVVMLLVGALVLLTVAELGRGRVRMSFGILGIVATIGATAAFLFVELGLG
jgi:uncharacterized membrane protein (DUF2068 family)